MMEPRTLCLFNCDRTYKLDAVQDLINATTAKSRFVNLEKHYFSLAEMSDMSTKIIPKLEMDMAFFVVHAHESRLLINEDKAGTGYAKIYRALQKVAGENVIIVIGGDDNYTNEGEEDQFVISRWAKRKISSQFREEFLDGRKGFIFSWNKKHRKIHEEALLHFFDSSKKGQKFEHQPTQRKLPAKPVTPPPVRSTKLVQPFDLHSSLRESSLRCRREEFLASSGTDIQANSFEQEQAPEMSAMSEQKPVVEDDKVMSEKETQPHSLSDHKIVPDKQEEREEEFKVIHESEIDTLLVKTRLRYGQLSKSDKDTMVRNKQWTPPDELLSHISDRFKDVAEADLEIYRVEETGVIHVKITQIH